jgi:hypothetical protein
VGGLDDWFERDPLLKKVEMAVGGGDHVEVVVGWGELNPFACKGVEGFKEQPFALMRKVFCVAMVEPVVEEDSLGDGGMVEKWERKLADAEIPVGVASPLDVERVAIVEGKLDVFALEFVDNGSVVNTVDRDVAAGALVEEAVALLAEFGDVDGGDVELVLVDVEVREGLLVVGVDLEEDYVFGVVVADDDFAEELPVGLLGKVAEILLQIGIEVEGFDVLACEDVLVAEDGGECLELDEFWAEGSVGVADQSEIDGHEVRMAILVGNAVWLGDGSARGLHVSGVVEELTG